MVGAFFSLTDLGHVTLRSPENREARHARDDVRVIVGEIGVGGFERGGHGGIVVRGGCGPEVGVPRGQWLS